MGETTIDGLSRRPSTKKQRVASSISVKKPEGTLSSAKPKTTKRKASKNDFLSPVQGFGTEVPDNDLGAIDDADWSDLLDKFDTDEVEELGVEDKKSKTDEDDKKDKKKQKKGKKNKKSKKKRKLVLKIVLGVVVVLAIVFFIWGDAIISKLTGGRSGLWDAMVSLVSDNVPFETDENGRTNVLIFGTEGYDMDGSSGNGQHDGAQLTDSIMVVSFDQETKDVALLSLPRDLKVSSACYAGKINEVYTCNNANGVNEEAGAEALMKEVGMILGIDFQYWAHVNWASLVDIIDTIGGITITLDENINDYGWTGVSAKAGVPINVNGQAALAFARARHGTTSGDFTRGNTQQKIVEGIVQKVVDNGISVTEAFNLLNILGDNLHTNFSTDNLKTGVSFLSGFNASDIRNVPLVDHGSSTYYVTTATINGISYVVPSAGAGSYKQIRDYVAMMFSSNPAMREGATIAVFNGTDATGVAGNEQTALEDDKFVVDSIGDAPTGSCPEKYCLYVLDDSKTGTKSMLEERYGVTARGAGELPANVWPGDVSFVLIIGQAD